MYRTCTNVCQMTCPNIHVHVLYNMVVGVVVSHIKQCMQVVNYNLKLVIFFFPESYVKKIKTLLNYFLSHLPHWMPIASSYTKFWKSNYSIKCPLGYRGTNFIHTTFPLWKQMGRPLCSLATEHGMKQGTDLGVYNTSHGDVILASST